MPPRINKVKCEGCGICLWECGKGVFAFNSEENEAISDVPKKCVDCFICELKCPHHAISVIFPKMAASP